MHTHMADDSQADVGGPVIDITALTLLLMSIGAHLNKTALKL